MTCITALKYGSDVFFACDSQNTDSRIHYRSHPKWIEEKGVVVAVSGDSYVRTLIEVKCPFQGDVTRDNVMAFSITLRTTLPNDLNFTILIGGNSSLFRITKDFEIIEVLEYDAIGSGQEVALGSLYSTRININAGFRVEDAVRAAIEWKAGVGGRVFNVKV